MADKDKINKYLIDRGLSILEESTKAFQKKLEKERKLKKAVEVGFTESPLDRLEIKIKKDPVKEFLKHKKKIYANEHPRYRSNYKKD